jgi:dTDP-4-amino-4,6-dideoxygalactose transaminase
MAVFKSDKSARIAKLLRNQGMEARYMNEIIGFNLRMTDIHAAIGRVQLKQVGKWTATRIANAEFFIENLEGVVVPSTPAGYKHVYHQFTIRVDSMRSKFIDHLTKSEVGSGVYYPIPVHRLKAFNLSLDLPETSRACDEVLSIPVHPNLSKRDLNKIVSAVNSYEVSK